MKKILLASLIIFVFASTVIAGTWAFFSEAETIHWVDLEVDGENDPNVSTYFNVTHVEPCDQGFSLIRLKNVSRVDGVTDIHLKVTENVDNGINEPEDVVDGVRDGSDGTPEGDLYDSLYMRFMADLNYDGKFETLIIEGRVSDIDSKNIVYGDLRAYSTIGLKIEWWVDCDVGNIIQSDRLAFDIEFSLEQQGGQPTPIPTPTPTP